MDAINVEKLSARKTILLPTNAAILERNPTDAFHVVKSLTKSHSSLDIRDVTQERNHSNAFNVGSPFLRNHTSVSIREVRQDRNLISVVNVGKLSVKFFLTSHEEIYTGKKSQKYSECWKDFSDMSDLIEYKRIHTRDSL